MPSSGKGKISFKVKTHYKKSELEKQLGSLIKDKRSRSKVQKFINKELNGAVVSRVNEAVNQVVVKNVRKMNAKMSSSRKTRSQASSYNKETKVKFAVLLFVELIRNTPIDEEYDTVVVEYFYGRDREGQADVNKGRLSDRKILNRTKHLKYRLKKVHHVPDEDSVVDHWTFRLGMKGRLFTMKDFSGVDFDSDTAPDRVYEIIDKLNDYKAWRSIFIENKHERIDQLEYGTYKIDDSYKIAKEKERDHGVKGHFSVQAPHGFIRLAHAKIGYMGEQAGRNGVTPEEARKLDVDVFKLKDPKSSIIKKLNSDYNLLSREKRISLEFKVPESMALWKKIDNERKEYIRAEKKLESRYNSRKNKNGKKDLLDNNLLQVRINEVETMLKIEDKYRTRIPKESKYDYEDESNIFFEYKNQNYSYDKDSGIIYDENEEEVEL